MREIFENAWAAVQAYPHSMEIAFGVVGVLLLIAIVASLIVVFFSRRVFVPTYAKDEFFHKVLRHDRDVKHQYYTFGLIVLGLTALILYLCAVDAVITLSFAIATLLCIVAKLVLDINVKFDRIEYNPRGLYQHRFAAKVKVIEWQDLTQVMAGGQGKNRVLRFVSKQGRKITVKLAMMGAYEFSVFAAKQLEGKNFEAIKIAQARNQ